jgi:hypothetical protein
MNPVIPLHDDFQSVLCVQLQAIIYKKHMYRIYFNDMRPGASWKPRFDKIVSGEYRFHNTKVIVPHEVNLPRSYLLIEGFLNLGVLNNTIRIGVFYQLRQWNVPWETYLIRVQYPWNECFLWERPFRKLIRRRQEIKRRIEQRLTLALCWTLSDGWLGKMPVELLRHFA